MYSSFSICYFVFFDIGPFPDCLSQSLSGRALSFFRSKIRSKMSFLGALGFVIVFAVKALLTAEVEPNMMLPTAGTSGAEGASSDSSFAEPRSETEVNQPTPPVAGSEGPEHQTELTRNASLEASLRNRIQNLENANSILLLQESPGGHWEAVKQSLFQASSQLSDNELLDFENRDLRIRELKHECHTLLK